MGMCGGLFPVVTVYAPPETIDSALERSLDWAQRTRASFAYSLAPSYRGQVRLLKPFSEYLLALDVLRGLGHRWQWMDDAAGWAWSQIEQGDALVDLLAARPDLLDIVSIYANLRAWGYENSRLESWLERLWALRSTQATERPLWCRLALQYNFHRLGMAPSPTTMAAGAWLSSSPEPWTISVDTAYATTHEVFYLTDFGRKSDELPDAMKTYVQLWLPAWIDCFIAEDNWDVTSELLMVASCINNTDLVRDDLVQLALKQRDDGTYPCSRDAGSDLIDSETDPARREFLNSYHLALVGLLAVAMASDRVRQALMHHEQTSTEPPQS
jgi:hypothetical protein